MFVCCLFLAGQEKLKPKKPIDLFEDDDDDDGDIFSEKSSVPAQSKKEVAEEQIKRHEKKVKIDIYVGEFGCILFVVATVFIVACRVPMLMIHCCV